MTELGSTAADQAALLPTTHRLATSDIIISRTFGPGRRQEHARDSSLRSAVAVSVQLRRLDNLRIRHNGWIVSEGPFERGALAIADLRQRWDVEYLSRYDEMQFRIPLARLEAFAGEVGRPEFVGLACPLGFRDDVVLGLARALLPALEAPEQASPLFIEHISLAMLTHLTQCYGGLHFSTSARGALARWQEKRATEILAAHLDRQLSIATLAEACELSRSHFIKAFKESFGRTPHRWLMEYRTSRAKALLPGDIPIADIALACGFTDQSHFSRVFRAATGVTPGQFRQEANRGDAVCGTVAA
ncbi:MAG: AraC family transcriptional regulator [Ancalomicrobiaceae bacterium]|nr:AraC family transcriptional regulator [Ancalomicrobiaceae bacterium]